MGLRDYRPMVAKLPKWVLSIIHSDGAFLRSSERFCNCVFFWVA